MKLTIFVTVFITQSIFVPNCHSLSAELCDKICDFSSMICWVCSSVHKSESADNVANNEIEDMQEILSPKTKAEMIFKAKFAHPRQQKIVGGMPVNQGESPWTVRYVNCKV